MHARLAIYNKQKLMLIFVTVFNRAIDKKKLLYFELAIKNHIISYKNLFFVYSDELMIEKKINQSSMSD